MNRLQETLKQIESTLLFEDLYLINFAKELHQKINSGELTFYEICDKIKEYCGIEVNNINERECKDKGDL